MSASPLPLSLLRTYPPSLALTRLKTNLFLLLLLALVRAIFTPYLTIRRGLIWLVDSTLHTAAATGAFAFAEWTIAAMLVWNVAEAGVSVWFPVAAPPTKVVGGGLRLTPARVSSPLTRSYSPSPSPSPRPTSTPKASTSTQSQTQPQSQPSFPTHRITPATSTPTRLPQSTSSPHRSSPLSASTAKALGLSTSSTASATGMFHSPGGEQPTTTAAGGEYVMVEREEKEWVENVWKGVRGKGGRVGL